MAKNKRFLGCQYPLTKTARGILAQKNGVNQIKADLLQLLLTNPGERCMLPDYGTPLRQLMFEPNDVALVNQARNLIAASIKKWEPRIELKNIIVSSSIDTNTLNRYDTQEELEHILSVKIIFFDPIDITEIQELVLEVPLASGS